MQIWKSYLRKKDLKQKEINDLLEKINKKIIFIKNETKTCKSELLMNESIYFEKYEKSILFGKLSFYSNKIKVLAKNCGNLKQSFKGHTEAIRSIQVDEKSNRLISLSDDQTVKIWDLSTGECLKTFDDHIPDVKIIFILPNKKFICVHYADINKNSKIKIWDINTYECLNTFKNDSPVESLCLISNNLIACGCNDGSIMICDFISLTKIKSFKAHYGSISILLLADKTKLISSCNVRYYKSTIKIWSLETCECIKVLYESSFNFQSLDITLGCNLLCHGIACFVSFFEKDTGEKSKSIEFVYDVVGILSVNEELMIVALENGEIQLYNYKKREIVKIISAGDKSCSNHIYLSKNGYLLSGKIDGQINLYELLENN